MIANNIIDELALLAAWAGARFLALRAVKHGDLVNVVGAVALALSRALPDSTFGHTG